MSTKPIWIEQFARPAGTEIKHIGNHWYLYERLSVYDKEKKKKRKKSGRCLGALTETGLTPSKRATPLQPLLDGEIENLEYGATAFLLGLTSSMRTRLARLFPDCWREIFGMALLKCKEQSRFRRMDFHYETSFISQCLGSLSLSAGRVTTLLRHIGLNREAIREYMKEDLPADGLIMFDGHRLLSASGTLEYACIGYDSKCRFHPQVNLLYMFSVTGLRKLPVFYKQFAGNVPDVTAFSDIVADSGVRSRAVTVIADKGFGSELNETMLDDASLGYILAVRRGCADIPEIPSAPDKYQKVFKFRGRAVYCNEYQVGKGRLFLYYDMSLANDEAVDFINRREKANNTAERKREAEERRRRRNRGRLSQEEYERLVPRRRGGRASGAQGQRHIHAEDQQARHQLRPGILPVQDTAGHRAGLQVIRRHAGRHGQLHARPVFVRGMAVHQPSCASDALCRHRHACREGPDRQILLRGCHGIPKACPGKPHRRRVATDKNH